MVMMAPLTEQDRVVIIGAGHAGGRAAERLRAHGFAGGITLVGKEDVAPYERPPLSKSVLLQSGSEADTYLQDLAWYAENRVTLRLGQLVTRIDRDARKVFLLDGETLPYSRLVIATGGRLRDLPVPGADLDNVLSLKTMADAVALRARLDIAQRLVVIGGGFIGLEVAASARALGCEVTVVEATERLMGRAVPQEIGARVAAVHEARGTTVRLGCGVQALIGETAVNTVVLTDGQRLAADLVVVGIGIAPETGLAEQAGLETAHGILVDDQCRTSDPAIFAIGDVACHRARAARPVESWQNAEQQATRVAAALMGGPAPETEPPWFWSDQGDLNLQIAGTPANWDGAMSRGRMAEGSLLLIQTDGRQVTGAIGVNAKKDMLLMRKLLKAGCPVDADSLTDPEQPLKKTVMAALRA